MQEGVGGQLDSASSPDSSSTPLAGDDNRSQQQKQQRTTLSMSQPGPLQWVSDDLNHLLRRALEKDPSTRLTWPELLAHPLWKRISSIDVSSQPWRSSLGGGFVTPSSSSTSSASSSSSLGAGSSTSSAPARGSVSIVDPEEALPHHQYFQDFLTLLNEEEEALQQPQEQQQGDDEAGGSDRCSFSDISPSSSAPSSSRVSGDPAAAFPASGASLHVASPSTSLNSYSYQPTAPALPPQTSSSSSSSCSSSSSTVYDTTASLSSTARAARIGAAVAHSGVLGPQLTRVLGRSSHHLLRSTTQQLMQHTLRAAGPITPTSTPNATASATSATAASATPPNVATQRPSVTQGSSSSVQGNSRGAGEGKSPIPTQTQTTTSSSSSLSRPSMSIAPVFITDDPEAHMTFSPGAIQSPTVESEASAEAGARAAHASNAAQQYQVEQRSAASGPIARLQEGAGYSSDSVASNVGGSSATSAGTSGSSGSGDVENASRPVGLTRLGSGRRNLITTRVLAGADADTGVESDGGAGKSTAEQQQQRQRRRGTYRKWGSSCTTQDQTVTPSSSSSSSSLSSAPSAAAATSSPDADSDIVALSRVLVHPYEGNVRPLAGNSSLDPSPVTTRRYSDKASSSSSTSTSTATSPSLSVLSEQLGIPSTLQGRILQ